MVSPIRSSPAGSPPPSRRSKDHALGRKRSASPVVLKKPKRSRHSSSESEAQKSMDESSPEHPTGPKRHHSPSSSPERVVRPRSHARAPAADRESSSEADSPPHVREKARHAQHSPSPPQRRYPDSSPERRASPPEEVRRVRMDSAGNNAAEWSSGRRAARTPSPPPAARVQRSQSSESPSPMKKKKAARSPSPEDEEEMKHTAKAATDDSEASTRFLLS